MRIRTTFVAVVGATLFALAGAGTAQAHGRSIEVDRGTVSGGFISHGCGHHGSKVGGFHASETHVAMR